MSKNSDRVYPGDLALAQRHLRLARECRVRAFELDPTLRRKAPALALDEAPKPALDQAIEEQIISRAIATAHRSNALRQTSRKVTTTMRSSHAFDADALFQREPSYSRADPRLTRRPSPARVKAHALDAAEVDRDAALAQATRLRNHISNHAGKPEFDSEYVSDCFLALAKALGLGPDDGAEDISTVEAEEEQYKKEGYTDADLAGKSGDEENMRDGLMQGYGARGPGALLERSGTQDNRSRGGANWRSAHDSAPFDADALLQRSRA